MSFNVDWPTVAAQLTPPLQRQPVLLALARLQLTPVALLHADFLAYVTAARRSLAYNSRVLLLEAALNDLFDAGRRAIYITHDDGHATSYYVGTDAEYNASALPEDVNIGRVQDGAPPAYFFGGTAAEYIQPTVCVVHVPDDLYFATTPNYTMATKVSAVVTRYQFAGLAHKVIFYPAPLPQ